MTSKGLGMTAVVDDQGKLVGIYTDGDLRRSIAKNIFLETPISELMSDKPVTVSSKVLAAELVAMMKQKRISAMLVVDDEKLVGALNMQDLLRAGIL